MERNAHYFIIGIFVSVCIVLSVGFVIWLAGSRGTQHYNNYTIYFTDAVSGLNVGASVQYKGVQVGKVVEIRLDPERHDLIKVDVEVQDTTPVHITTTASLATLGVTGLVYIQLETMANDEDQPLHVDGERYPVIKGSGSALTKLFEDVPQINKRILNITTKIDKLLTPQSMASINEVVGNVQLFTAGLNTLMGEDNLTNASTALQNISSASADFAPTLDRLKDSADQLQQTLEHMNRLIASNEKNINRFTDQGLRQITATSNEAQGTARSIKELTDKLKQNPSQLIFKPSYTGVEVKK